MRILSALLFVRAIPDIESIDRIVPVELIWVEGKGALTYVVPVDDFDWGGLYGLNCQGFVGNDYTDEGAIA